VDAQSPIPHSVSGVGVTLIVLSGALDQYGAESLKEQLLASLATPAVALDMTGVEHIDAAALQVLLAFRSGLKQEKLQVVGAAPGIQQWLRIAGADSLFEFSNVKS
jgi:anti-anti-sigma factor